MKINLIDRMARLGLLAGGGGSFTPLQQNWQVFADASGPSSGDALAGEGVKPTLANNNDIIRFRVSVAETGGKASNNAVTVVEYSTDESSWFSLGASNHWDHANGVDTDGNTIASRLLSDSGGSGTYCETSSSTCSFPASTVTEFDISIVPTANVASNTTYYFRVLLDGTAVALNSGETHPQVLTASVSYTLTCTQGSFSLTGQTSLPMTKDSKMVATQGSFALSGQSVNLLFGYTLTVTQGAYTLTGQTISLIRDAWLTLTQGAYALTGQSVGLFRNFVLAITQGAYALTGQSVSFIRDLLLTAIQGAYALTGYTITLTYSGGGGPPGWTVGYPVVGDRYLFLPLYDPTGMPGKAGLGWKDRKNP